MFLKFFLFREFSGPRNEQESSSRPRSFLCTGANEAVDRANDLGFAKVTTTVKKFDPASMRRGYQPAGNISSPGRLRLSFNDVTVDPAAARARIQIINRRDAIYAAAAS